MSQYIGVAWFVGNLQLCELVPQLPRFPKWKVNQMSDVRNVNVSLARLPAWQVPLSTAADETYFLAGTVHQHLNNISATAWEVGII